MARIGNSRRSLLRAILGIYIHPNDWRPAMTEPIRISPEEARKKVIKGEAILVCAYEDEEKFKKVRLQGAISLQEFRSRLTALSGEQEIIFY
jgi:hypothetical protein